MPLLHAIEAHLDLVHLKPLRNVFCNQCAIGEKHGSKIVIPQDIIDPPELRMKQGLAPREKKTKSLHFLELLQDVQDLLKREVLLSSLAKVAMSALEIAAIGQLKLQIPKGGDGRLLNGWFPLGGCVDPVNEALGQAILNKLFVLFPDDGFFSLRALKKKLEGVPAELVKFIILDIVNTRLLEIF
jgi:hypothetical protein